MKVQGNTAITFHDFQPDLGDFLVDMLRGLAKTQKEISPKYFYDECGSALFEAISELPEYYPTRTEIALLNRHQREIADLIGPHCTVIEFGSGSSRKIEILLSALQQPLAYMPVDVCREFLLHASQRIAALQPALSVVAVCADYMQLKQLPESSRRQASKQHASKTVVFFPGSSIGNCAPLEAIRLLKNALKLVGVGGGMLVGVDLKKDAEILHAAYNDAQGVTAEFNLNILVRANRELGADFRLDSFHHQAFYNQDYGRIEMHLVSLQEQTVRVKDSLFPFRKDETLHTENSCKYSVEEFQGMARAAGFRADHVWVDQLRLFSLHFLTA